MTIALQNVPQTFSDYGGGPTTIANVVVNAGTDRILVVCVSGEDNGSGTNPVTGVTFGGVALTQLDQIHATSWSNASIWYKIAPAVSTADVVITMQVAAGNRVAGAYVFTGVDQTTPFRTPAKSTADSGTSVSDTVAGVTADDYLIDVLSIDGPSHSDVVGIDQVERWDFENGGHTGVSSTQVGPPAITPFPSTAIIDNFDRANEDPLGTASSGKTWSGNRISGTNTYYLRVTSNQCLADSAGDYNNQYITGENFGPDVEVYFTMPTIASVTPRMVAAAYGRITGEGTSQCKGYEIEVDHYVSGGEILVYRMDNSSTFPLLATYARPGGGQVQAGDSVGMRVTGTGATVTIETFFKVSGGSWVSLGTVDDTSASRLTTAGKVGLEIYTNTPRVDDFGGGTVIPASLNGIMSHSWTTSAPYSHVAGALILSSGTVTVDQTRPDADVTTTGWTTTPLYSKINDSSDATVIQATAS